MSQQLWHICELIFTCTFNEWYDGLDGDIKGKVDSRIILIRKGHMGSFRNLGEALFELKWASTLRVYFGRIRHSVILIFGGTNKTRQQNDIDKARVYWNNYQVEKKNEDL